jgi:hypothetical protein
MCHEPGMLAHTVAREVWVTRFTWIHEFKTSLCNIVRPYLKKIFCVREIAVGTHIIYCMHKRGTAVFFVSRAVKQWELSHLLQIQHFLENDETREVRG